MPKCALFFIHYIIFQGQRSQGLTGLAIALCEHGTLTSTQSVISIIGPSIITAATSLLQTFNQAQNKISIIIIVHQHLCTVAVTGL